MHMTLREVTKTRSEMLSLSDTSLGNLRVQRRRYLHQRRVPPSIFFTAAGRVSHDWGHTTTTQVLDVMAAAGVDGDDETYEWLANAAVRGVDFVTVSLCVNPGGIVKVARFCSWLRDDVLLSLCGLSALGIARGEPAGGVLLLVTWDCLLASEGWTCVAREEQAVP